MKTEHRLILKALMTPSHERLLDPTGAAGEMELSELSFELCLANSAMRDQLNEMAYLGLIECAERDLYRVTNEGYAAYIDLRLNELENDHGRNFENTRSVARQALFGRETSDRSMLDASFRDLRADGDRGAGAVHQPERNDGRRAVAGTRHEPVCANRQGAEGVRAPRHAPAACRLIGGNPLLQEAVRRVSLALMLDRVYAWAARRERRAVESQNRKTARRLEAKGAL